MDGQTVLNGFIVLGIFIWAGELVWLYKRAVVEEGDPIGRVSGAAGFFVLAAPLAVAAPDLIDRVAGFWERAAGLARGAGRGAGGAAPRLMIGGKSVPLNEERIRIGRYPANDVVLDHPTVSAYHAEIMRRPDGRHELIDRESRNGTRINGTPIRQAVLRDGDQLTLGAMTIHYLSRPAAERQPQHQRPRAQASTGRRRLS